MTIIARERVSSRYRAEIMILLSGASAALGLACSGDNSSNASVDAGGSTVVPSGADGGGKSYCSSIVPPATFCADFDDPGAAETVLQVFDVHVKNGTCAADTTTFFSAPRALRVETRPQPAEASRVELYKSFPEFANRVHVGLMLRVERLGAGRAIPFRFRSRSTVEIAVDGSGNGHLEAHTAFERVLHPLAKPLPIGQWQRVELDADFTNMPGTVRLRFGGEEVASGPMTTSVHDQSLSYLIIGGAASAGALDGDRDGGTVLESDHAIIGIDDVVVKLE